MEFGTFRLNCLDEPNGPKVTSKAKRLVCQIEGGGKLVIWGSQENSTNIDTVRSAGLPCTVRCQWRRPGDWGSGKFGHTHWVPESAELEIVP